MARWRIALQILLGATGVGVIAYFLYTADLDQVGDAIARLAVWLPLLFAIEGARIAVEAIGTRSLYGRRIPIGPLARAHVIGYSLTFYMPAGRATGEAVKAMLLAKYATPARAAAVAAANQSLALLGHALAAFACMVGAATVAGTGKLVASLAVIVATSTGIALALRVATLRMRGSWVRRFAPRFADLVEDARSEIPRLLPPIPLAMFALNRALQLAAIAMLLYAVGGDLTPTSVLIAGGVNLVGATLGDMIPAQLGATDATFSVAAGLVGLTPAAAISIALALHIVQMTWMAIGLVIEIGLRLVGAVHGKRVT